MFVDSYDWDMSVLEEHLEELQALWYTHSYSVRSSDYSYADLLKLQERIAAHVDGVVLAGIHASDLLRDGLASDEAAMVFASVVAALRLPDRSLHEELVAAFDAATEEMAAAFMDGFCTTSLCDCEALLHDRLTHPSATVASMAAYILAFHGRLTGNQASLQGFLCNDSASVRQRGWEIIALLGQATV